MQPIQELINQESAIQIVLSLAVVLTYFILRRLSSRSIFRRALVFNFDQARIAGIRQIFRILIGIFMLVLLGMIWEVSLEGLSVYIASILAVIGVGLFATWSIVSNVTASIILFFFFPIKIGSKIKIIDGDNSVLGEVLSLSPFSIRIKTSDESEVYYPNNLAIQKGISLTK